MTKVIRGLALYVLVGISMAGLTLAQAQEVPEDEQTPGAVAGGGTPQAAAPEALVAPEGIASGNHVLKKTYFQTVNDDFISLSTTFVNAFAPTTVTCPSG